jgi:hypothetical protein
VIVGAEGKAGKYPKNEALNGLQRESSELREALELLGWELRRVGLKALKSMRGLLRVCPHLLIECGAITHEEPQDIQFCLGPYAARQPLPPSALGACVPCLQTWRFACTAQQEPPALSAALVARGRGRVVAKAAVGRAPSGHASFHSGEGGKAAGTNAVHRTRARRAR